MEDEDEDELKYWQAIIIGPQESPIGQVIYNLKIDIPQEYPRVPPEVRFVRPRVCMECVDDTGKVDVTKIMLVDMTQVSPQGMVSESAGKLYSWEASHKIADVLVAIRENMHLEEVCNTSSCFYNSTYQQ